MKIRRNLIFIILLVCSLGLHTSKVKNRKYRASNFIQQEAQSLATASYLSAPASSESSGCFFDTSKHLIETLDAKVAKYTTICNLENNSNLKGITDLLAQSKKLGQIKAKLLIDPAYLLTIEDKQAFTSVSFPELQELGFKNGLTNQDITNAVNVLKEKWETIAKENGYPVFMKQKAWVLAQFKFSHEYLSIGYSNSTDCLPVTEDIKNIIDLVVVDLNEEGTALNVKGTYSRYTIEPEGFDFGGYALAFWVKEDNTQLTSPLKLI